MASGKKNNSSGDEDETVSLAVDTVLGEVSWVVSGMELDERLDEPFALSLELQTDDTEVDPSSLLGTSLTLTITRGAQQRELSGVVEQVDDGAWEGDTLITQLRVVPALVALSHRTNSKIFQDQTIPATLQSVLEAGLGPHGRSVDLSNLTGSYASVEYVVQYRETDLDFACRLMQEHGISYLLRQALGDGVETLYLFDSDALYVELSSNSADDATLAMSAANDDTTTIEKASSFTRSSCVRPTVARAQVFDWKTPATLSSGQDDSAAAGLSGANGAALSVELEDYDHREPATSSGYRSVGLRDADVDAELALRRGLHQRDAVLGLGAGTATLLAPGTTFTLDGHDQAELNTSYLAYRVVHRAGSLVTDGSEPSDDNPASNYGNTFYCVPEVVSWKPARSVERPRAPGIQTAIVVGEAGEEIFTDAYGRIKVQFHWDRDGSSNEDSSCFIRVAQPVAGNGFGFMFLPRVGMEVVVTFIDGDLDRPIVTSCLYNGANSPPYTLPDDKTKSTIRTQSSPSSSGGYNELRFEDEAGAEEVYLRAQKDLNAWVGNDRGVTVTRDEAVAVGNDQTLTVSHDQAVTVSNDQRVAVSNDQTLSVTRNQTETIGNDQTLTVTNDQTVSVENDQSLSVTNGRTLVVGGAETHTVSGNLTQTVGGNASNTVTGNLSETVSGNVTQTVTGSTTLSAEGGMTLTTPSGVSVASPSASDWVDVSTAYGAFKFTFLLAKLDIVPVAAIGLFSGVKADFVHVKVDVSAVKVANTPLKWGAYTTHLKNAAIAINTSMATIFP